LEPEGLTTAIDMAKKANENDQLRKEGKELSQRILDLLYENEGSHGAMALACLLTASVIGEMQNKRKNP